MHDRWPLFFKTIIDAFNLRELTLSGRQFTWANNQQTQTCEKLHKSLVSTEWDLKFSRTIVQAFTREISDILLSF
jgi:chemotaxis regulatin CheY-phosphate phosphatase CheZ